jgi:hypothetical protein
MMLNQVVTAAATVNGNFRDITWIRCNMLLSPWTVNATDNPGCFSQGHINVNPTPLNDPGLVTPVDKTWKAECGSKRALFGMVAVGKMWYPGGGFAHSFISCCPLLYTGQY